MSDVLPDGYGAKNDVEKVISTPDQEWVCTYLDKWFSDTDFKPSASFKGALAALRSSSKIGNTDWLAQSAHSMREIFYVFGIAEKKKNLWGRFIDWVVSFFSSENSNNETRKTRKEKMKDNIAITQEEKKAEEIANLLNKLHKIFTVIAHHFGDEDMNKQALKYLKNDFGLVIADVSGVSGMYENIIEKFVFVLKRASEDPLEILNKIEKLIKAGKAALDKNTLNILIHAHINARDYFFSKAPIDWIDWLHQNGFFDVLNVEAEDKTRYAFRMPELGYLASVVEAGGDEGKVVEIMQGVDCVKNFNPEVVERFLWIAQKLSAESLVKIVPKIKKENWIELMKPFKPSGYSYQPIVKKLAEAKEYGGLLILADALLALNEDRKDTYLDNYFALSDVGYTEIFDALADMEGEYAEKGIEFILDILKKLIREKNKEDKSSYECDSGFYLFDVDLFDISINKSRGSSDREDLKSLLAALLELIERRIAKQCKGDAKHVYEKYFAKLPDTHWMWRIRLFAMQFCPEVFESELKEELSRFLSTEHYIDFLSGTPEFYKVLSKVFPNWPEEERRNFVKKVFEYFDSIIAAEEDEKVKKWTKEYGWRVLSAIAQSLTEDEAKSCGEKFEKKPDPNYEPEPSISGIRGGTVQDRSPVEISAARYGDISALIEDLKGELSPETLKEKYKHDDFLSPRNAEGVGNALKEDMKLRMSDYLSHSEDFLDPALNIHYTYSFLRGIEEQLRAGQKLSDLDWKNLFKLFEKFLKANKEDYLENSGDDDRWLARWVWVEKIIADILKDFLTEEYKHLFADKRAFVLKLLEELLQSEDPKPEHEVGEHGDLFHVAINSTRGVAFQAFVNFVYRDGEKLQADVFELYKKIISESSLSVRFVIGHYLASFYYRDKTAIKGLFSQIFLKTAESYEDFFAAWQGYLANTLYKELFEALAEYYDYALGLDSSVYPERRKNRDYDLDKSVATHLALAFAHFDEAQYTAENKHPLLEKLWGGSDQEKQKEFVSFLGRGIISNGSASDEWFKEKNVKLEKLQAFWVLILEREDLAPEVYAAFGFWVNHSKDIFDYGWLAGVMAKTVEKSQGQLEWDYGTLAKMDEFAKADPASALLILGKYLLEGILGDAGKNWFYVDDEKVAVFRTLYQAKPDETTALINQLLEKGGRTFWPLKDVIEN